MSTRARILVLSLSGVIGVLSQGCIGLTPRPSSTQPLGTTSAGVLVAGVSLPDRGPGFVRARPGESTRFGTSSLVGALTRAVADVDMRFAGTAPMRIGDLGGPEGGRHPRHHSHRGGRDADLIFYLMDASGRSVPGRGWLAFSRYGHAFDGSSLYLFDDARNWHFVRTLLADPEARVQWIFCSRGVKARLLRYAVDHESDSELWVRAAYVLHQPERAAPHDDHFHVRIFCTPDERASGCMDTGPRWPWLRPEVEETSGEGGGGLDDASLVAFLLEGEDPAAIAP